VACSRRRPPFEESTDYRVGPFSPARRAWADLAAPRLEACYVQALQGYTSTAPNSAGMGQRPGPKERLFGLSDRIPLVKEAADPIVAAVLGLLVVLAIVGISIPGEIFPHDNAARSHILQLAGGLILVLGAYYTSVNLRELRAHQYLDRLAKNIELLGAPNQAVRMGSIRLLQGIALERPALPVDSTTAGAASARRHAIREALETVSEADDARTAQLAATVLAELRQWEVDL
jgi:hypothetical protein